MANFNCVMLIGRLTRDPELKYLQDGTALAHLDMAINKKWRDKSGNEKEETCFVNITAWKKTAELCTEYLKKGSSIMCMGELKTDSWIDQEGKKHSRLEVRAQQIQFLDRKEKTENVTPESPEQTEEAIPF